MAKKKTRRSKLNAALWIIAALLVLSLAWVWLSNLPDRHSLPLIGGLFPAPYVKVLVVGSLPLTVDGKQLFATETFRVNGVTYAGAIPPDAVMPGTLENYDYVVVAGVRECNRDARAEFANYLQNGGRMVLVGDACSEFQGEKGWSVGDNMWGDLLPVVFVGDETVDSKIRIYDVNNPVFNGIVNFRVTGSVARVTMNDNAVLLAFIGSGDSYSADSLPAVVYGEVQNRGKNGEVYYFAFDVLSQGLWLNLFTQGSG